MKTNDLKKGAIVILRNGWKAEIYDNMKGNTRMAKVYGDFTEIGSVYAHDIKYVMVNDVNMPYMALVEHTPAQLKLKTMVEAW